MTSRFVKIPKHLRKYKLNIEKEKWFVIIEIKKAVTPLCHYVD